MPLHEKEKRRYKRYSIRGCQVRFKKTSRFVSFLRRTSGKNVVLDISENGLQFVAPKNFKHHVKLILNIGIPSLDRAGIRVKGRVVWTRKAAGMNVYGTGVEFTDLDSVVRTSLKTLLEKPRDKAKISEHIRLNKVQKI